MMEPEANEGQLVTILWSQNSETGLGPVSSKTGLSETGLGIPGPDSDIVYANKVKKK